MADIIDLSIEREKRRPAPKLALWDEEPPKSLPDVVIRRMMMEVYKNAADYWPNTEDPK